VPDPRSTAELVESAAAGDAEAWNEIVARYAVLVVSVCRRFHLAEVDIHDVSQNVWLELVERLDSLREPAALPGWLVTTTRHECMRLRRQAVVRPTAEEPWDDVPNDDDLLGELLAAERRAALRVAFAALPPVWRQLVELLVVDPPMSYAEISQRLGVPVGSIGPTRARILRKLRRTPAIASLLRDEPARPRPSDPVRASTSTRGKRP
jgi:RNA polymerase sigma factor (sigma-70 family)